MAGVSVKWHPSDDGFVESHNGDWRIVPCYAGCTRPQDYQLWYSGKCIGSMFQTQREAKEYAEQYAEQYAERCATSRPRAD